MIFQLMKNNVLTTIETIFLLEILRLKYAYLELLKVLPRVCSPSLKTRESIGY